MTQEEQIKWMTDRIAHLEHCHESAMGMVSTLMGKLKPPRAWVGLTDEEIASVEYNNHPLDGIRSFARAIEAKLKERNG
jgi:hypothetical protein